MYDDTSKFYFVENDNQYYMRFLIIVLCLFLSSTTDFTIWYGFIDVIGFDFVARFVFASEVTGMS